MPLADTYILWKAMSLLLFLPETAVQILRAFVRGLLYLVSLGKPWVLVARKENNCHCSDVAIVCAEFWAK